ncbi:hypothetical protein PENTCL1PPCAC_25238 [Pristionchus entomophagus]|uniref:Uncharacterized protein n=1 Tax=Pristionchus entomophagus TaxID=358040 RepID=A0AAV5U870_9BILA|nr:hypothetical protein PENTCL1PPCAC_25238 [Pristionchus entomophagus]
MTSCHFFIAFAILLQTSLALVEFTSSKLYDEKDLAVQKVSLASFCDVGCRVYASVPSASARIAKNIMVQDNTQADKSLFDISKLSNGEQKSYFAVLAANNSQVNLVNKNRRYETAPLAVWIVREDADNIGYSSVFEAASLNISSRSLEVVTVMSAEPFTLRSKTEGPMEIVATMTGFGALTKSDDECTYVIEKMQPDASSDIQVNVQSPLITLFYDDNDFEGSKTSVSAQVGRGKSLGFSGISFVASPGYIGCKGGKTFRSSLYGTSTSLKYSDSSKSYDVAVTSFLNTDGSHPVKVKDNTNRKEYKLFGTTPGQANIQNLSMQQTNNVEISWSRNSKDQDQSFLVRLMPSNEQNRTRFG